MKFTFKNCILFLVMLVCNIAFGEDVAIVPTNLRVKRVTFTKVTIEWEPCSANTAIKYCIIRNGTKYKYVEQNSFTDHVIPGKRYNYSVSIINEDGTESPVSNKISVQALQSFSFDKHKIIQQTVDQFHSSNINFNELLDTVTGIISKLGNSQISFKQFDIGILKKVIAEESEWLNAPEEKLSADERKKIRTELDQFLKDNYGGHSFFSVYTQMKLIELADQYKMKKNYKGATSLYKAALNIFSDVETTTSMILYSLAKVELEQMSQNSDIQVRRQHLKKALKNYLNFFKYCPNASTDMKQRIYTTAALTLYKEFPNFLTYKNYDKQIYKLALQLAQKALELDAKNISCIQRLNKIKAWELVNLKLSTYTGKQSKPSKGHILVNNVSNKLPISLCLPESWSDSRKFRLGYRPLQIKVYAGHLYDILVSVDIPGGAPVKYNINSISPKKGKSIIYEYGTTNKPDIKKNTYVNRAQIIIKTLKPKAPYNLHIEADELCWDWFPPNPYFKLKHFKVYNDGVLIGTTQKQHFLISETDSQEKYWVEACDTKEKEISKSIIFIRYPKHQNN